MKKGFLHKVFSIRSLTGKPEGVAVEALMIKLDELFHGNPLDAPKGRCPIITLRETNDLFQRQSETRKAASQGNKSGRSCIQSYDTDEKVP
jgi:hypothetical protein